MATTSPTGACRRTLAALALGAVLALARSASAQEPLFTFVQISDSQPQTAAENQGFVDVLRTIAEAGQPGKLLPEPVDLVLFAGDITWGNTEPEWIAAKQKLDTWLSANGIPYRAVPGNHDVDNSDTTLYQRYVASSAPWDIGSAAFTGHNGLARATGWQGLRFIGFDNSNPGWNTIPAADVADIAARVSAAAAAGENVFLLCHHPHDEKARMPLASVLPDPSIVGYLHGHLGTPQITRGLVGVVNPNVWNANTNAIVNDRCLIYYEVFPGELQAHVVVLDNNPTALPAPVVMPLVHPLTQISEGLRGVAGAFHAGARAAPSGEAPERKLWHQAGSWWGILWSDAASAYRIWRLDAGAQAWVATGTSVSSSPARSFDVLADGSLLHVASNVMSVPAQLAPGAPGSFQRFRYDAGQGRYALDAGFPVALNDAQSETLALAKDSTGVLWATWTRAGTVFVSHAQAGDGTVWSGPIAIPFADASGLAAEETSAIVALGSAIGVLWPKASAGRLSLALHADGAPGGAWTLETALADASLVGDQIDLVQHGGRALAVVRASGGALSVLERSAGAPGSGSWSVREAGAAADGLHDPCLVVDQAFGLLRLYATGPTLEGQSVQGGGAIYEKVADLLALAFPHGRGTPVVQDGLHPSMGFATSARAPVDAASDLVLLASNPETERYWHCRDALASRPLAPVASFSATPLGGAPPLVVRFTDLSSNAPTDWSWDFGDGASSSERDPEHVYSAPGTYAVSLRAASGAGEDTLTRPAYVTVSAPASLVSYAPIADARVSQSSPSSNFGRDTALRVKTQSGSSFQSFLLFDLRSLPGAVLGARLRLLCTDPSNMGGSVYQVAGSSWTETGISWNNKPALPATPLFTLPSVSAGSWTEADLGGAIGGPGLYTLALAGGSTNSALYSSREGTSPPQLVLELAGGGSAPVADFSASPLAGPAPLAVAFSDLSTNSPASWSWDFGDGAASTERDPVHVYTQPGTYTVLLDATNAAGTGSRTRLDYIGVAEPPPVRTFLPTADAKVYEGTPSKNLGLETTLRVKAQSGSSYQSFLRFDLASLSGGVRSARLRLFCTDPSNSGGRVYALANSGWTETGITWASKPALPPSTLAALGAVALNTWTEIDVSSAVGGPGTYVFALAGGSTDSVLYSSREGASPPQLVVETGALSPPVAGFSASPLAGSAPLAVAFTDLSTGATSWSWSFGDGASSSERNPTHVYAGAGTFTVTLQVSNAAGSSTLARSDLIAVAPPASVQTFLPLADARVNEAAPGSNYGQDIALRVRSAAGGSYHTYLRFDLSSLAGAPASARLRLFATDGSDVAGIAFSTSSSWSETGITWANKPATSGPQIASAGTVATGAWIEFDVSGAIGGPGIVSFALQSSSSNSAYYSSREGANPPQLVIGTSGP